VQAPGHGSNEPLNHLRSLTKAAEDWPHSITWRKHEALEPRASVLECGQSSAAFPEVCWQSLIFVQAARGALIAAADWPISTLQLCLESRPNRFKYVFGKLFIAGLVRVHQVNK
jgi:hypothetical protein